MTEKPDEPRSIDAGWHTMLGQFTGGLSPAALTTAYVDWALHLAGSPEKQSELVKLATSNVSDTDFSKDPRFADPAWATYPYNLFSTGFLATENWWDTATKNLPGVDPKHADIVNFAARQWLDMMSPANFAATNPQVMDRTRQERGRNLIRGAR